MKRFRLWLSFFICGWLVLLLGIMGTVFNWLSDSLACVALGIAGVDFEEEMERIFDERKES